MKNTEKKATTFNWDKEFSAELKRLAKVNGETMSSLIQKVMEAYFTGTKPKINVLEKPVVKSGKTSAGTYAAF